MIFGFFKWTARLILGLGVTIGMVACTQLGLNYASLETDNKPDAWPPLDLQLLQNDRDGILRGLETHVFGPVPQGIPSRVIQRRVVDKNYANGTGILEEVLIGIGEYDEERRFNLAIAIPKNASGPVPVIINQTFCPNRVTFRSNDLSPNLSSVGMCGDDGESSSGIMGGVITNVFGRYIASPPTERILNRGYALASFYASEIVADDADIAPSSMKRFPKGTRGRPSGTVAAWTSGYVAAIDILDADARFDQRRTAVLGHSRHGKSALVAGAFEPRIEAVITHQAGTGGTALSRNKPGETVASIAKNYPHWFAPSYANFDADGVYTTPTDMHLLIALNAPKKVLLGNGRRDVWSDPNGSYRAALAADPAWEALGMRGLAQDGMNDRTVEGDLVFYMRQGGHGIVKEDWTTFLDFLDAEMAK